jgi:LysM repeat protein
MFTYIVQRYDSLRSIAQQFGTTYQDIMAANQLNTFTLRIGQALLIPNAQTNNYQPQPELVWAVATDDANEYPVAVESEMPIDLPANRGVEISERAAGTTTYTVKAGDNLSKIAALYKTTPDQIKKLNKLTTNVIQVGQVLKVPSVATSNPPPPPPKPAATKTYTVKAGDTLTTIAWIFEVSVEDIKKANNLKTNSLLIGQVLSIPTKSGANYYTATTTCYHQSNTCLLYRKSWRRALGNSIAAQNKYQRFAKMEQICQYQCKNKPRTETNCGL